MWYTGDWLKDPAVSNCSPSTRGIWVDALNRMHENNRSGSIRGTREQLSRSLRCSLVELDSALREIQNTGTGVVAESDGLVTLSNRRMKREAKTRNQTRLRMTRFRGHDPGNASETGLLSGSDKPSSSSTSSSESHTHPPPREALTGPNLKTVLAWASMDGCPADEAERFWQHFESMGWRDRNSNPIVNARAKLAVWKTDKAHQQAELAAKAVNQVLVRPVSASMDLAMKKERLKRLEDAVKHMRDNKPEPVTPEWKREINKLKAERDPLYAELGFPPMP